MGPTALVAYLLLAAPSAHAAEPAACAAPYSTDTLAADLSAVQTALRTLDDAGFEAAGKRLEAGLVCLDRPVAPGVWSAAYRYIGAWHFLIPGDERTARRWFRSSLELDPAYAWDADEIDPAHPLRVVWEAERAVAAAEPVAVPDRAWAASGGAARMFVDGRPSPTPAATLDRPHVVQRVRGSGPDATLEATWLVDGNLFPAELLAAPVVTAPPLPEPPDRTPPPDTADDLGFSSVSAVRERPPAKTPLLIVGAAGVLAAGGVYALSWDARQDFDAATTGPDLRRLRDRTNTFVLASGATLVVGVGIGTWGVALDGGGRAVVSGRF